VVVRDLSPNGSVDRSFKQTQCRSGPLLLGIVVVVTIRRGILSQQQVKMGEMRLLILLARV
jgi:hypothetical protein